MRRTQAKSIGEIINQVLRQERSMGKLDEHRAVSLWPEIVGPGINQYTVSRSVKDGVMTIGITSASLRNELMLTRTSLIHRINEALGHEVIKEIIFR